MYQIIFKYRRSDSVTGILLVTGLPSFDTVGLLFNAQHVFSCKWSTCNNEKISSVFSEYRIINFNAVSPSIMSVCLLVCLSAYSLLFAVYSHLSVVCFCAFVCFIWAALPEINVSCRIVSGSRVLYPNFLLDS